MKLNILFIINPISGGKSKSELPDLIQVHLDHSKFNPNYTFTEYIGHAGEIADEAATKNFDVIVAVGGDGTINEIATKVKQHGKVLGIIPYGSGNGLARFLRIPMNIPKAVKILNQYNVRSIDTAKFNNRDFFNIAGMGFDAHISLVFAGNKTRGFAGYIKLGLKEMINYKPGIYKINIDGRIYNRSAYAVSIANSSQYGNNAYISPQASITDGLLDVCIVKPFSLYKIPLLMYYMLSGKTDRTNMIEIIKGKNIDITRNQEGPIHLDGEPFVMEEKIVISVDPLSLNIIVPDHEA